MVAHRLPPSQAKPRRPKCVGCGRIAGLWPSKAAAIVGLRARRWRVSKQTPLRVRCPDCPDQRGTHPRAIPCDVVCRDCKTPGGSFSSKAEAVTTLTNEGWSTPKKGDAYRMRCPACRHVPPPREMSSSRVFRDVVLEHVPGRSEVTFREIAEGVLDDWGSVTKRSIQRALARLYWDGEIERWGARAHFYYQRTKQRAARRAPNTTGKAKDESRSAA